MLHAAASPVLAVAADHRENAFQLVNSREQRADQAGNQAQGERPLRVTAVQKIAADEQSRQQVAADEQGRSDDAAEDDDVSDVGNFHLFAVRLSAHKIGFAVQQGEKTFHLPTAHAVDDDAVFSLVAEDAERQAEPARHSQRSFGAPGIKLRGLVKDGDAAAVEGVDAFLQVVNGPVVRNAILYKLFKKFLRFLQRQQGVGVPFAEVAGGDLVQSALRQREDAELVGHDAAAPTDALGQLVLGELVFFHQGFESVGGLEHGQIFALKILYEGDLAEELLVATDDAHGHFRESGQLAGVKTAFAGNDAVFLRAFCRRGGDDQRLKQPMNFDGRRQFVQRCAVEDLRG